MNLSLHCLAPDRIQSLLECELSPTELAAAEEHLTHCANCRGRLEQAIGSPDWWQDARESLGQMAVVSPDREDETSETSHADVLRLLGPTDDPRMMGRVGAYEITGILGRGGMGVVFKGFDGALNRFVAIKMLAPHLAASGAARKRFEREAQAAAAVVHDHVMAIHSVAEWQGVPYFVMPYVKGSTLQKRLEQRGTLELPEILRIGMQTAGGLAAAHAQGLVHRDVKPANILLADGVERVTLMDFGLARAVDDSSLTRTGVLAGTPQYMSPEQARGKPMDFRSDLFSLGSVLYTLCTGRAPFRAETSYGVLRLITDEEPQAISEINPQIPAWLGTIIAKLMAKRPDDRYVSAREVAELLETCLAHVQQPLLVKLPSVLVPKYRNRSAIRRSGGIALLVGLCLLPIGFFAPSALIQSHNQTGQTQSKNDPDQNVHQEKVPASPVPDDWFRLDPFPELGAVSAIGFDHAFVQLAVDAFDRQTSQFWATFIATERSETQVLRDKLRVIRRNSLNQYLALKRGQTPSGNLNARGRQTLNEQQAELWQTARKQVESLIDDSQSKRIAEVVWQRWGYHAFMSELLREKLKITSAQKTEIQRAIRQHANRVHELDRDLAAQLQDLPPRDAQTRTKERELTVEKNRRGVESHKACWAAIYQILSSDQRMGYETLRGRSVTDGKIFATADNSSGLASQQASKPHVEKQGLAGPSGLWCGEADKITVKLQFLDASRARWKITLENGESWDEKLTCQRESNSERFVLSVDWEGNPEKVAVLERQAENRFSLTIQDSKFSKYPRLRKLALEPDETERKISSDTYRNSRRLAAMEGWVIAWDVQNPISHGDGARVARLRVFPDGRVAAVQDVRSPLVEARILPEEVQKLINDLIDKCKAGQRKSAGTKREAGQPPTLDGDPLPESLWDQNASRIAIVRNDQRLDLLSIEPPHLERKGPASDLFYQDGEQRLKTLLKLAMAGGREAQERYVAFANAEIRKRDPETSIELTANDCHSVGHDSDGTLCLMFHFSADPHKLSYPSGEITLRIPVGGEPFVDKAAYWIAENQGQQWGRAVEKPAPAACAIEGVLIDDVVGKPVADALIACGAVINETNGGGANARTDVNGKYRLEGISPGIYNVWLKSYESEPRATAIADEGLVVESGKVVNSTLRLRIGTKVTGVLIDQQAAPVVGASIGCYSTARPNSAATVQSTKTNQKGEFEFYLPPGRAHVYVMSRSPTGENLSDSRQLIVPTVGVISPFQLVLQNSQSRFGSADWLQRSTPGTEIIRREGNQAVTGIVVDPSGKPIANARVFKHDGPIVRTNEQGEFQVEISKGTQFIMNAQADGYRVWFGTPTSGDVLKIVMEAKK